MKCEEFREIVFELASGELDSNMAEAAEKHMADCPQCREDYENTFALTASLRALAEEEAPKELLPNVMNRISAENRRRRMNSIIRFGTAAAAAVVLVVGAVNVLPALEKKQPQNNDASIEEDSTEQNYTEDVNSDDENLNAKYILEDNETTADDNSVVMDAGQPDVTDGIANASESKSAAQPTEDLNKKDISKAQPKEIDQPKSMPQPQNDDATMAAAKEDGGADEVMARMTQPDIPEKMSLEEESALGIYMHDEDAYEPMDTGKAGGASGGSGGSAAGGSGGGSSRPLQNGEETLIITAGIDNGTVIETEERSFISRKCEFIVSADYAETAGTVDPRGKSMARVSAELSALGVEYEVYITEDDHTAEYAAADAASRAEIEAMCAVDNCIINIR